jgi:hypothetical protein
VEHQLILNEIVYLKNEHQINEQDHIISSDFNMFQKSKNTNRLIWFGFAKNLPLFLAIRLIKSLGYSY